MINVTSKLTYTSSDAKLMVYETTVKIDVEDPTTLMAELETVLKAVITYEQFSMKEMDEITRIMNEATDTLAERVRALMGGELM